jgi:pyruvate kinase
MSRIRSISHLAFTRHEHTRRRVTLYRGVYPVSFDITHTDRELLYGAIFEQLCSSNPSGRLSRDLTKGELSGVSGGTTRC